MKAEEAGEATGWRWFWFFLTIFAVWIGFMLVQARRSANPVIVSRPQVLSADAVVEGTWRPGKPILEVERVWWGTSELKGQAIEISGMVAERAPAGARAIVPLSRVENKWQVAPLPPATGAAPGTVVPEAYPAVPQVERQFVQILDSRRQARADSGP